MKLDDYRLQKPVAPGFSGMTGGLCLDPALTELSGSYDRKIAVLAA
jgi:hypothetical protein